MGPIFDVRRRQSVRVLQRRRQRHAVGGLRQIVADGEGAEAVTEMATEPGVVLPAPWRADTAERAQHLTAGVRTGGATLKLKPLTKPRETSVSANSR